MIEWGGNKNPPVASGACIYTVHILYYTILYYTILYYTILYYTILYCTSLITEPYRRALRRSLIKDLCEGAL